MARRIALSGAAAAALLLTALPAPSGRTAPDPTADRIAFHALQQESEIASALAQLQQAAPARRLIIRDVKVVDPDAATVTPGQSVIVGGSQILWVGDRAKEPAVREATVIDGKGRYLSPGLTDMHMHSGSASGWLLNLNVGVTTVRDMDGFPWQLRARQSIADGAMLGPTLMVAGTIINDQPMEGYAVVPSSPLDARRIVRQQAACGYDFIKIHNSLSPAMFDAVAEQARTLGIDLVGHVPHGVTLTHALAPGAMRTAEHLKGFLRDSTLTPNDDEDYAAALNGREVWLTPTLFNGLNYDRAAWARGVLDGPSAAYVPLRRRETWSAMLKAPDAGDVATGVRFRDAQAVVMKRLIPLHPRWLAGTDADGYPFSVMGYALIEELRLLRAAGLTPVEVLRAATTQPARATRQPGAFGAVRVGMRADLVLLVRNPLEDPTAYAANDGVVAHGYWLPRDRLDAAMKQLAVIQAEPDGAEITEPAVNRLIEWSELQVRQGFVFDTEIVQAAAEAVGRAGLNGRDLANLNGPAPSGACALTTPH